MTRPHPFSLVTILSIIVDTKNVLSVVGKDRHQNGAAARK